MAERFEDKLRARRGLDDGSINHGDVLISEEERDALADAIEALRNLRASYGFVDEEASRANDAAYEALARLDGLS